MRLGHSKHGAVRWARSAVPLPTLLDEMRSPDFQPNSDAYASILQACGSRGSLAEGKLVHAHIVASGLDQLVFLGNHLVSMYVRCGSLQDARHVFEGMRERNVVSWTGLIAANAQNGHCQQAFALFRQMQLEGVQPNTFTFVQIFNAAAGDFAEGRRLALLAAEAGIDTDLFVGNAIISMYSKCGSLQQAKEIFDRMRTRDVVSWTSLVGAYVQQGYLRDGLQVFRRLLLDGSSPNNITFVTALGACSTKSEGIWLHSWISESGLESDLVVANALANMYSKCGTSLDICYRVFEKMPEQDLISWNAMITACAEGKGQHPNRALQVFQRMQLEGVKANSVTFISLLNFFSTQDGLEVVGDLIVESGFYGNDTAVSNALLNAYSKFGDFQAARDVFLSMSNRDLISWNAMLAAVGDECGRSKEALKLFQVMLLEGMQPNRITLATVLNSSASLEEVRRVHRLLPSFRIEETELTVGTTLVSIYGRCGSLLDAESIFQTMPLKNLISWNAIIGACAHHHRSRKASKLFHRMLLGGEAPDTLTFTSMLSACCGSSELAVGRLVQACILESGCQQSGCMDTALVNMYGKCGSIEEARKCFDEFVRQPGSAEDVVLWTSMVAAYAESSNVEAAQHLFRAMQLEGVRPDRFSFTAVLDACSSLSQGKLLHDCVLEISQLHADVALDNAVLSMYSRCGSIDEARAVFQGMKSRDVVSWNAMAAAYASSSPKTAVELFRFMLLEHGVKPDKLTLSIQLNASANLAALSVGKLLHGLVEEMELEQEPSIAAGLVKMYSGCGKLDKAVEVFEQTRDWSQVVVANETIAALALHGRGHEAVKLFRRMEQEGRRADKVTLLAVMSACSHGGLVEEGWQSFLSMTEYHGVVASAEHYACLVDVLSRAGKLEAAEEVIRKMPPLQVEQSSLVWKTLLSGSRLQGDMERSKFAASKA